MSTNFKNHIERKAKAQSTIKAYTANGVGIDKDTKAFLKDSEDCNIAVIRLPTFQAVTPSPSSALNALAILLANDLGDSTIAIKYIHVRKAQRDKLHATALLKYFVSEFSQTKTVHLTEASGFDSIRLWLKAGFQVQEWSETSIRLLYANEDDASQYIASFSNELSESDNEWARTTLFELVKEEEEKVSVVKKIVEPSSRKRTLGDTGEAEAKKPRGPPPKSKITGERMVWRSGKWEEPPEVMEVDEASVRKQKSAGRPKGRAPNSKITGRPMIWLDGAWVEDDDTLHPGCIKATCPGSNAAKCSKGQGPRLARQQKKEVESDSSDEEEDEDKEVTNSKSDALVAIKRNLPSKAFFLYCNNKREKVQLEMPDAPSEDISNTLADKWLIISEERRKKYTEQVSGLGPGSSPKLALQMWYYNEYNGWEDDGEEEEEEDGEEEEEEKPIVPASIASANAVAQGLSLPEQTDEEFVSFPPSDDRVDSNGILRKEPEDKEEFTFEMSNPGNEKMIELDGESFVARSFSACSVNGVSLQKGETIYLTPDEKDEACEIATVIGFYRNEKDKEDFVDVQWCFRPDHLTVTPPSLVGAREIFPTRGASDLVPLEQFEGKCQLTAFDSDTDMTAHTFPSHSYFCRYYFAPSTNTFDPIESDCELVD